MTLLLQQNLGTAWGAVAFVPAVNRGGMGSIGKNTRRKRQRRYRRGSR